MGWVNAAAKAPENKPGSGLTVGRLLRWTILLVLIVVIVQMLRRPAPVASTERTPQQRAADAASFRAKLDNLQDAHVQGGAGQQAVFTEDELNGYIQQSIAELGSPATAASSPSSSGAEEAQQIAANAAQKASVALVGDEIRVQTTVERFGKEFVFSLSGHLGSEDGYATFHPTSCKLGALSVPLGLVDDAIQKKLAEPENREKMKLPDFIQSVRVENSQLVVVEK
jgi:hypothetical protein